jgi:methionyl-tRNA synthetase
VRFKCFALALLLLMFIPVSSFTQNPQIPGPSPNLGPAPDAHEEEEHAKIEKEMAKKANHERQAQLHRDTDNLLKLATELKQYVDKSNENTLSLDVVRKAEEIEKLAHSVKEKMKAN